MLWYYSPRVIIPGSGLATSASAALRDTPAPDDAGAETADRYEWQAMMATADLLAAYFQRLDYAGVLAEGQTFTVICELHEDWALVAGDAVEIVSAKHREASVARLATVRSLFDCGVLHLFERWDALRRTPMCRLVTTAGVADDAAKVVTACDTLRASKGVVTDDLAPLIEACAQQIAKLRDNGTTAPEVAIVTLFLMSLRVQHGEARREHVPDLAPTRFTKPIAERLGRPDAADAIWTAVLALVRERMRAAGPVPSGGLPTVLGAPHPADPHVARSVTLTDVDVATRFALSNVGGYVRLPRLVRINKLAVKLSNGGCSDNTIERLDNLRLQHRGYWRDAAGTPAVRDRRRRMNNSLLKVVSDVTEAVRTSDRDWGLQLLAEVEARLQAMANEQETGGLDADLLLGAIADLSNDCKVWFSDRFDVDAEIARLRAAS